MMKVDIHQPIDDLFYSMPMYIEETELLGVHKLYCAHHDKPTAEIEYMHLSSEIKRSINPDCSDQDRMIRIGCGDIVKNHRRRDDKRIGKYLDNLALLSCQLIYNSEDELVEAYSRKPSKQEISAVMGSRTGPTGPLKIMAKHFWLSASDDLLGDFPAFVGTIEELCDLIGGDSIAALRSMLFSAYNRALLATVRIRVVIIDDDSVSLSAIYTEPEGTGDSL